MKAYFPPTLDWFEKLDTNLVGDLLERWASPEALQEVPPAEPWTFFRQRRGRHQELTEQRMEGNCQAMPAIRDRAMLEGKRASHGGSERTTATHLLQGIANLDSKTEEAANAHPEVFFLSRCQDREARWRFA